MDLRKLKTLIDLVSESNVTELEITEAEGKVRIVKGGAGPVYVQAPANAAALTVAAPLAAAPAAESAAAAPTAAAGASITAPMVGTFYRSPNPSADPFVEVGTQVKEGQTVCIIEAMKILNEIEADRSGTIKQILVDNGQAVEYGQPLFIIE
ncbi:acetyl-CoA carboxylase biotin carboxyl carrier protein [Lampropedia puyangensis]|uniref:Biotin carboxyl carrier protein of acetyl-CoA carboxylase n=1 Tax=Lampropedia puyangensis TaxID=1330072 RepID=A0A4V4GRP8_9BURK|nr:acetyl-CoA carboxylase biotin carboxyl carrier protein [Lampropedia puyangensis]THU01486.1 acetyl-CoA carboxylase biotin carboxyl carrier protein [Lampropedia puyangensis]